MDHLPLDVEKMNIAVMYIEIKRLTKYKIYSVQQYLKNYAVLFIRSAIKNCLNVAGECCANVNQLLFSSLKPQFVTFVMSEINDKTKTKMLYKCHDINQKLTIYKGI